MARTLLLGFIEEKWNTVYDAELDYIWELGDKRYRREWNFKPEPYSEKDRQLSSLNSPQVFVQIGMYSDFYHAKQC